jgi:uncharacterized membrane protein YwaF
MITLISIAISGLICLLLFLTAGKASEQTRIRILKWLTATYFLSYFASSFYHDYIGDIYALISPSWCTLSKTQNLLVVMARLLANITLAIYPLGAFFKNRHFKNLVFYIGIPANLFFLLTIGSSLIYLQGTMNYELWDIKSLLMIARGILGLVIPLFLLVMKYSPKISRRDWGILFINAALIMSIMIPLESMKNLFGTETGFILDNFKVGIIWIIQIAFSGISLYIMLHNESYELKYATLITLAISTIVLFFRIFSLVGWSYSMLPFQICNLGTVLVFLMLLTKNKTIFRFTYFANVIGTVIAITIRDTSDDIFGISGIHYTYAHAMVFLIPILAVAFGLFPKQTWKDFFKTIPGFSVYFLFCLIFGTWFVNYDSGVNYFFLLGDTVTSRFHFLIAVKAITYQIGIFKFYPIYQLIVYFGFVACMVISFMCVTYGFKIASEIRHLIFIANEEKKLNQEIQQYQAQHEEAKAHA